MKFEDVNREAGSRPETGVIFNPPPDEPEIEDAGSTLDPYEGAMVPAAPQSIMAHITPIPQEAEIAAPEAAAETAALAPASIAASAAGVGLGVLGAQAAIGGIQTLGEAAKSPQGSISAFLPANGGGGNDYAGQALSRAMLAALNSVGSIASRFGG